MIASATKDYLIRLTEAITKWLAGLEGQQVDTLHERGMKDATLPGDAWVTYAPTDGERFTITVNRANGCDSPVCVGGPVHAGEPPL